MRVEGIILSSDRRGISKLKKYLPIDYCRRAAEFILQHSSRVIITTGFYIKGTCETDGIAGSISLANILRSLGSEVVFVSDKFCVPVLKKSCDFPIAEFPMGATEKAAANILKSVKPTLIISVERCGVSSDGKYYNCNGKDITEHTARIDALFRMVPNSVAVGDGGNEIGMGNILEGLKKEKILQKPCVTKANHLVIASVSDLGCYGIIAYMSQIVKKDFLNFIKPGKIARQLYRHGALDGITGKKSVTVDGRSLKEIKETIQRLLEKGIF